MKYKLHISEAVRYYLTTKKLNWLDIVKKGDLQLHLKNFEPNIKKIGFECISLIDTFQNN
jgi:hypothetical protein